MCHGEEEKKLSNVGRDYPLKHTLNPSYNTGSGPVGVKSKEASVNRKYMCNRKPGRHSKSFLCFGSSSSSFKFNVLAMPLDVQDLGSLTRDQTCTPCSGSAKS